MSSQEIKRKLIENTKMLIRKNATVTIKDIAEASYVNIAAVNYHFGSKEQLLTEVINEVLSDLKTFIKDSIIKNLDDAPIEEKLEELITFIYNFSMENIGILNYLFLSKDIQSESSGLLIDSFFSDNEFTRYIYEQLAQRMNIKSTSESFAKYIILFSAFSIPLFIQIAQMKTIGGSKIETFKDPLFRQHFIKNIMKMVQD
ncbi:MAG: TetR/AcrR family transcriptional regulator [Acholeplasmataceae bacterium]|nr:TetR/AcrR family transcriptional regulator [Acholeplasmataceae bacterium]